VLAKKGARLGDMAIGTIIEAAPWRLEPETF
jgi:hypothetical protein